MNLLAIDTATEICSAALQIGEEVLSDAVETPRDHSRLILSMVDQLLVEAGISKRALDGLAFGRGPGSFTGVRIAAGVAHGIALAWDCPVVPVSNLAAIAQRSYRETGATCVLTAIDARMSEVYWGAFQLGGEGLMEPCIDEQVCKPEMVNLPAAASSGVDDWTGAGTGWVSYGEELRRAAKPLHVSGFRRQLPHAQDVLQLSVDDFARGKGVAPEFSQPVYLRDKVAATLAERGFS